jgi:hypothetical protein
LAKHTGIPVKKFLVFSNRDAKLLYKLIQNKVRITSPKLILKELDVHK